MRGKATRRRVVGSRSVAPFQRRSKTMDDQLLDERHAAIMSALGSIQGRLEAINGRVRTGEQQIAVLSDRSGRSNAIAISALSAVVVAVIYWVMR